MTHPTTYCGIDISADSFDICIRQAAGNFAWQQLPNTTKGFKALMKLCPAHYHFVMENTGVFHLPLCFFLHEKKRSYSVVNALQIKRYIQMNLEQNKTDEKDAFHICMYGNERKPEQYKMPDRQFFECRALNNSIVTITAEITAFSNKIYAQKKQMTGTAAVLKSYRQIVKILKIEMKKLQGELQNKLLLWQPELVKQVMSVKGIGIRATATLIVTTQGFKNTHRYQQLISYAGLSPKFYTSGKSTRGKVRISKKGDKQLRHILYMCALNAKTNNPACKALFDRLVARGKNKKLALIAVCNKLLKQVFAVVKSGRLYSDNYYRDAARISACFNNC